METIPIFIKGGLLLSAIFLLCWGAIHLKNRFLSHLRAARKQSADQFTLEAISKILTIAILFIGLMLILQVFGLDIIPLLTLSGIGAAILGFASKDVVANFFGGSMIYATRPFHVGDFIEIPSRKISGKVEEIGWYLTTIRDLQKKTISLPNAIFSTELLLNHSRITHRRIEERLRFRITDPKEISRLIDHIRTLLKDEAMIDQKEEIDLYLLSIGSFGCEIELKAYVKTTKYGEFMSIKERLLLAVYGLEMMPPPRQ